MKITFMTKKSCKKFYLPDKEMSRANGLDYHLDLRAWKVRKYEFDSICYFDWQVDESVQTVGDEVVSAPADLWESKPASAEYWYKKKGWRKKITLFIHTNSNSKNNSVLK